MGEGLLRPTHEGVWPWWSTEHSVAGPLPSELLQSWRRLRIYNQLSRVLYGTWRQQPGCWMSSSSKWNHRWLWWGNFDLITKFLSWYINSQHFWTLSMKCKCFTMVPSLTEVIHHELKLSNGLNKEFYSLPERGESLRSN